MHPQLNQIAAQHIADLHRAAEHNRLVRAATSAANPGPRGSVAVGLSLRTMSRWCCRPGLGLLPSGRRSRG
jgi:hypothetical protein